MPYGSLLADVVKSSTSSPITFQNTSGTEIGTLCRAWVNFNGQGTVAIRASFNVSSITDNGTGNYTVNFTNAMPDANYSGVGSVGVGGYNGAVLVTQSDDANRGTQSTTAFQVRVFVPGGSTGSGTYDMAYVQMAFFR
jgi:hypothetical protein